MESFVLKVYQKGTDRHMVLDEEGEFRVEVAPRTGFFIEVDHLDRVMDDINAHPFMGVELFETHEDELRLYLNLVDLSVIFRRYIDTCDGWDGDGLLRPSKDGRIHLVRSDGMILMSFKDFGNVYDFTEALEKHCVPQENP
jgi:hypothetical protein